MTRIRELLNKRKKRKKPQESSLYSYQAQEQTQSVPHTLLNETIKGNEQELKRIFGNTSDLSLSQIIIGGRPGLFAYLSSMTDSQLIAEKIIQPLSVVRTNGLKLIDTDDVENFCQAYTIGADYKLLTTQEEVTQHMLNGFVLLFFEGFSRTLAIRIQNISYRSIDEPTTQTIIKGPKDGFTESADLTISQIRRRLRNPFLRFESYIIGSETKTPVYLGYVDGIVNPDILSEMRIRLTSIQTNAVYDSGNIEEFITDKTITPFPLVVNTERSDTATANLIAGKVVIIVEGTPFISILPATFDDFFQVSEDYYQPFMMASFIRFVRYVAFMVALILPAAYVGIITYHHELVPTQLLISIIAQREGIPFPAVVEALVMELTFEILREAGIRMPRAVGMTVSVVGGLVIGQAAVEAGIISNIMVIVVALTAIASFVSPVYSFSMSSRLLRFGLIFLSSIFGLYGIMLGLIVMVAHLNSLRSVGIPYLSPFAPIIIEDHKDVVFRFPIWAMKRRPIGLKPERPYKQPFAKSPSPPQKEEQPQ